MREWIEMPIAGLVMAMVFLLASAWIAARHERTMAGASTIEGMITGVDEPRRRITVDRERTVTVPPRTEITGRGLRWGFEDLITGMTVRIESGPSGQDPSADRIKILHFR